MHQIIFQIGLIYKDTCIIQKPDRRSFNSAQNTTIVKLKIKFILHSSQSICQRIDDLVCLSIYTFIPFTCCPYRIVCKNYYLKNIDYIY